MSDFFSRSIDRSYGGRSGTDFLDSLRGKSTYTDSQRELMPYIQTEISKERDRSKIMQPLQWVFDLLQTGNYVSANIVDEVIQSIQDEEPVAKDITDVLQSAWRGLTWQDKQTYADVYKKYGVGTDKIFPNRESGIGSNATWADVLGFFSDILLDPLTYVTPGASRAARSAATAFAQDSVQLSARLAGKNLLEEVPELVARGFSQDTFERLLTESADQAAKYVARFGDDMARRFNTVYKKAYKDALSQPADVLRKEIADQIDELTKFRQSRSLATAPAGEVPVTTLSTLVDDPTLARIAGGLEDAYSGAGQRKMGTFFGKEFGVGTRQANAAERSWQSLVNRFSQTKVGEKLSDAWWSIMNRGPVGNIRKMLGFRNPYQKYLRMVELDKGTTGFTNRLGDEIGKALNVIGDADDDLMRKYVDANDLAEQLWKDDNTMTVFDVITNEASQRQLGISPEDVPGLMDLGKKVQHYFNMQDMEFQSWVAEGFYDSAGSRVNYLPSAFKDPTIRFKRAPKEIGPKRQPWMMKRGFTRQESATQEASTLQWLFGISSDEATRLVRETGMGNYVMDLKELMLLRAYSHAKAAKRVDLLRAFREFGVDTNMAAQVAPEVATKLTRPDAVLEQMGMRQIQEKGLEGLLFDSEVADVLTRATQMVDPERMNVFQQAINQTTAWWKGFVTMTTGFHARNHFSNQVTLFMKHGAQALNPGDQMAALSGVAWVLKKTDVKNLAKELDVDDFTLRSFMNKKYGGLTVQQLAEEAQKRGVISRSIHGFDMQDILKKASGKERANWNPMSTKFVGQDVSYKIGTYVENTPKLESFMLDFDNVMKQGGGQGQRSMTEALDWAASEAKKWWIDYNDLTKFEQSVMKQVIPFYTWLRHNVANQISGILMHPDTFSMFPKIINFMKTEDPEFDETVLPDWMKQLGMFPAWEMQSGRFAMFNPNLPFQDINKVPLLFEEGKLLPKISFQEVKDDIINSTHPAIKTAMQLMTEKGYDFFYKTELKDTRKAPFVMRLFLSKPETLGILDGLSRWARGEGIDAYVDQNNKLQIDGKLAKVLEDNLPILRHLDYLFYGIGTLTSDPAAEEGAFEKAIEAFAEAEDDYDGWEQFFQVLAFYAGIKFKEVDIEEAKRDIAAGIYDKAVASRQTQRNREPARTERVSDYLRSRNNTVSRMVRF